MPRLPQPGSDNGTWGDILNNFLTVEHNADGSQKPLAQSTVIDLEDDLATITSNVSDLSDDVSALSDDVDAVESDLAGKADDDTVVHLTGAETISGIKTFQTDAYFKSGRPWVDVCSFAGVDPTGVLDSGPGIRAAAAAACASNAALFFPPGVYNLASFSTGTTIFVPLTRGISIFAFPGSATIKNSPSVGAWRTIFGTEAHSTIDMSDFHVDGLVFDGQSDLNPSTSVNAGQTRYVISAYYGQHISVTNCKFVNHTGRNIISFVGFFSANVLEDITIAHNLFDNIGTTYWHDHSTVYADGNRVNFHHNTFIGASHADGSWTNAWNPWEIHGQSVVAHHNITYNYAASGLLVSSRIGDIGGKPQSLKAHHNISYNVGSGISISPSQNTTDVDIHDNDYTISIDQWPAAPASGGDPNGPYPGFPNHYGLTASAGSLLINRVNISNNRCRWAPWTATPSSGDSFVYWIQVNRLGNIFTSVSIKGNKIFNCPASPVRLSNFISLVNWDISDNEAHKLGVAQLGASSQAFVSIGYQGWTGTRPVGIQALSVNRNKIFDDQSTHTILSVLHIDAGVARVDANVSTTSGSTTVLDSSAVVTDLGSLISHPNLPAGTRITNISSFQSGSSYYGNGYIVSAVATATGSASVTITSEPPTTSNCELLDTHLAVTDGATVPLADLQSGESIYLRSSTPHFIALAGSGGATVGSTITDQSTGTEWVQTVSPSGNSWTQANTSTSSGTALLNRVSYNPATGGTYVTTSSTLADMDATNLSISFTVPSSGKILVVLEAFSAVGSGVTNQLWNLREGSTDLAGTARAVMASTSRIRVRTSIAVSGLTPEANLTYKWGWASSDNTNNAIVYRGVSTGYGPAIMEVYSA